MLPPLLEFRSSETTVAARWQTTILGRGPASASIFANADGRACRNVGSTTVETFADPFAAINSLGCDGSRWAGFVSYELNRFVESLPPSKPIETPLIAFWAASRIGDPHRSRARGEATASVARKVSREQYLRNAVRAIKYIAAGDVFQINFAQSFDVATAVPRFDVWQRLRHATPATYGAFIDLGDTAILSNSPELFFRIEPLPDGRRRITTRPIKGTRPRGPGMREALERSEKDRAELAMIVDLSRNDLGRICEIGSVRVVEPRVIEAHPTVYHGVATIEGFLRPDVTLADVFRAMFPCGSITGCPKVRAMQIIDELEPEPRGAYCGAIGYVDADGSAEFSVAIRTMTMRDGIARVHVGGGIVADSDPAEEHRETIVKARAMLRALGVTDADIDALDAE